MDTYDISYSQNGISGATASLKSYNNENKEYKEELVNYVLSTLTENWNTEGGKAVIQELRTFLDTKFQDYIDYTDGRINVIDTVVLDHVNAIERTGM